jgi:CxxC-x17-CxxC domain-containing protein
VPPGSYLALTAQTEIRLLTCIDCQKPFTFSEDEQRFYQQRGFRVPVRCLDCRAARRAARNADLIRNAEPETSWTETLGHYGGSTNNARGGSSGRRNGGGGYPAVCAQWGKDTVVPFEPRSGRPVYCRDCFTANKRSK